MALFSRIIFNTLASSASRVIGSALALVSIGFITRALGREGFGDYATVLAYLAIFNILADLGLYTLMTREISRPGADELSIVSHFFTLRLCAAALLLTVGVGAVFLFPYTATVRAGIALTSFGFLFLSLSQILMGVFQRHLALYKTGIAEVLGRVAQLLLIWFFFTKGFGLFAYLGAVVAGSAVMFSFNLISARRLLPFRLDFSWPRWKEIILTALPIAVSLVFTLLYFKIDTIMLSLMKSSADVGIYNAAYKALEGLIFFPAMFVGLMMPLLSRFAASSTEKFRKLFYKVFFALTLGAAPVVIGGIILAPSIMMVIGGEDFLVAAAPLRILFLAVGLIFYGSLGGSSVVALNLQKQGMWIYFAGMAFNVVTNLIFIPKYSYTGAAWTTVATELLVTLLLVALVTKRVGMSRTKQETGRIRSFVRDWPKGPLRPLTVLPAVGAMGAVVFFLARPTSLPLSFPHLLLVVLLGGGVYALLIFLLRIVSFAELKTLLAYRDDSWH